MEVLLIYDSQPKYFMKQEQTMTDEAVAQWRQTIAVIHQVERLQDWANMLERRVAELDPDYKTYPWGRNYAK